MQEAEVEGRRATGAAAVEAMAATPGQADRRRVRDPVDETNVVEPRVRGFAPSTVYLTFAATLAVGLVLGRRLFRGPPRPPRRGGRRVVPAATTVRILPAAPEIVLGQRYKLRFQSAAALDAALAAEPLAGLASLNRRRRLASAVALPGNGGDTTDLDGLLRRFGIEVAEDHQFQVELDDLLSPEDLAFDDGTGPSLDDVLEAIGARTAWDHTRGDGVAIAIVDTGVEGTRAEFSDSRRRGAWTVLGGTAWTDENGHGTMTAAIAAAARESGGRFDGVAPDAGLIACKTEFFDTELTAIYDYLADLARTGKRIVACNSFGVRSGSPPPPMDGLDFPDALHDAVEAGVVAVFSAGNYHGLTGGDPGGDAPNSIWLYKSRPDVLTVGACKLDGSIWDYSSRGPGQDVKGGGTGRKPDVVAPTPQNGRVPYGSGTKAFRNGWGTSGACAQAAGLVALLWSLRPELDRSGLFELIRTTATPLAAGPNAQGHGRIDCAAAVGKALSGS